MNYFRFCDKNNGICSTNMTLYFGFCLRQKSEKKSYSDKLVERKNILSETRVFTEVVSLSAFLRAMRTLPSLPDLSANGAHKTSDQSKVRVSPTSSCSNLHRRKWSRRAFHSHGCRCPSSVEGKSPCRVQSISLHTIAGVRMFSFFALSIKYEAVLSNSLGLAVLYFRVG